MNFQNKSSKSSYLITKKKKKIQKHEIKLGTFYLSSLIFFFKKQYKGLKRPQWDSPCRMKLIDTNIDLCFWNVAKQ
jgi:hypothetical protein